ncbi:MAG: YicC family protein [Victivallaceae bacterium]|nr:YicC family protein [Victivallaceae bacterium]
MKSMTGFGQGNVACHLHDRVFNVEISTVNRKQLDLRINLPSEFSSSEAAVRKIISGNISRGAVTVKIESITADGADSEKLSINKHLLASLATECRELAAELGIKQETKLSDLLLLPGVVNETTSLNKCHDCIAALKQATGKAIECLLNMRRQEGEELKQHLSLNLARLKTIVEELTPALVRLPEVNREKLLRRITEAGLNIEENDERILREVVIFADRYDVSEELARLKSHFSQFEHFINNVSDPVGRSLEFVIQEIQREITTLGNKAAACDISPLVVDFKGELEKVREQVMNIE